VAFDIEFSSRALEHLGLLRRRDQQILVDAITRHLTDQPETPTRNRKRLEQNRVAPWELRVGDFRVFCDVDAPHKLVVILAIGHKVHHTLVIGGEEVFL
jgi:mRNA-degrading endonuclease RelE of RelBE toxin-antitoxin system